MNRLAILGFARSYRLALQLTDFEIWTFNDWRPHIPSDRHFQIHDRAYLEEFWPPWLDDVEHWRLAPSTGCPLYMQAVQPDIPCSRKFPKDRIEAELPRGAYHAGTVDWLVAYAILEGYDEIRLYGMDFLSGSEPISARPCLEYWLGVAAGRGIEVEVYGNSDVFRIFHLVRSDRQYAYDTDWRPIQDEA